MADIKFKIIKEIGLLSESDKGWKKELNLVSWNDKEPKWCGIKKVDSLFSRIS